MDIAGFVDFGIELGYFFIDALIYITISLVATGKFLLAFFSHGLYGITLALDFVPTCTSNGFACGVKAFRIFLWELGKSFDAYELDTKLWHILLCLTVFFIPFLREIVLTCLTFAITLMFAFFIQIFKVSRNRRRRTAIGYNRSSSRWSLTAILKKGFKKVKEQFNATHKKQTANVRSAQRSNTVNINTPDAGSTCIVCYEKPKCVLFLPCKHACLCMDCAKSLLERNRLCPMCRRRVVSAMQIYI